MPLPEVDRGPFLEGLDWLGRLPQPIYNVLRGRPGAAARTLADLGGDVIDAAIPGDWIPHIAKDEDTTSPHELLGIDPEESPALSRISDIVGNTVANPATYLTGGMVKGAPTYRVLGGAEVPGVRSGLAKVKELAQSGYNRLPEAVQKPLGQAATTARRSLNWLNLPPEGEQALTQAAARGNVANRVNLKAVEEAYQGLTPAEQDAVGEIVHGIHRVDPTDRATWQTINDPRAYLAGRQDVRPDMVKLALEKRRTISQNQLKEPGIFADNGVAQQPDYLQRQFTGLPKETPDQADVMGLPSALKPRQEELKTKEGLLKYLQETPDVSLEFNALKSDAGRASQQGRLAERAALGKSVTGMDDFTLSNPEHAKAMRDKIAEIGQTQPDYAYRLSNAFNGMPSRSDNWFAQGLAASNKIFKGAATYGILLPRIAFNVRNRTGGLWQALSTDGARGTIGPSSRRALSDLLGAFDDGYKQLTGSRLTGSTLTKNLDSIDAAMTNTGGSTEAFRNALSAAPNGAELVSALDNGVLDNFVSSEDLLTRMASNSKWAKTQNILQWPANIGQGLEQRMRLGTYLDLLKAGKAPAEAGKIVKDTYLNYNVPGVANRTFRDVVPFGAFTSQTIPQQAKFLAKYPGVAVGASQLLGSDNENIKYPSMEGQTAIPVGLDEAGSPQYITGLGLPIETLSSVPGLNGDDFYHDVVGQLQPILKTGIAAIANKDPYSGQPFGSYDKILGQHAGGAGRAYNVVAGTGLTQPLTSLATPVTNALDERKSIPEKLLTGLTGIRLQSVDPDLAQRQKLEAYLKSRPDIQTVESFYDTNKDPETTAVIQQLHDAKNRLKDKRKAAAAAL